MLLRQPPDAPPPLKKVAYTGPTWNGFNPGSLTVVQTSSVTINQFILIDITTNQTIVRPTGTSGPSDTIQGASSTPAPVPTATAPAPVPTQPATEAGREVQAIGLAAGRLDQCQIQILGGATEFVPVLEDPDLAFSAEPTGQGAGLYRVTMSVNDGGVYTYTVNVDTGLVTPGDEASAGLASECSGVFD